MSSKAATAKHSADDRPRLRVGIIGAGVIARVHCLALSATSKLFPDLPGVPKVVAVADVNRSLAEDLARRYEIPRVEADWRAIANTDDVDLVCVCLPPTLNHDIVLALAAAGKNVFCEKPLAPTAAAAQEMLDACVKAGVNHFLGTGYRWTPALQALHELIRRGDIGDIRHFRGTFFLDYASDSETPLIWRFRKELAGGGLASDTGYHLIDTAHFLVGEIESVTGLTGRWVDERPIPTVDVYDVGREKASGKRETGRVDVEDAAAALVRFSGGAYGVLETSRVATGRRLGMRIEIYGSKGAVDWDLERADEFQVCLSGDPYTFGFRRVLVNSVHPAAQQILIGAGDGTGIGWLGQQTIMWSEFITALVEGRPARANFEDGVLANLVLDAFYESAETGNTVRVNAGAHRLVGGVA